MLFRGYFEEKYTQATFEDLDKSETIVLWSEDIKDNLPVLYLRIKKAVRNGAKLIVFGHTNTAIAGLADFYFGKDGVSNNFDLMLNQAELDDFKNALKDVVNENIDFNIGILISIILSFIFSLLTLKYFLIFVKKFTMNLFIFYRIFLSLILFYIVYF